MPSQRERESEPVLCGACGCDERHHDPDGRFCTNVVRPDETCTCDAYDPPARILGPILNDPIRCGCWYMPNGDRIGWVEPEGCQAHPNDVVTEVQVWGGLRL